MAKFKVGDKVRILDGSKISGYTGGWCTFMGTNIGEVHTIEQVISNCYEGRVGYRINGSTFKWDERGLEPVKKKKQKIVIITDGKTTKARLYEDEKFVRQTVATCANDDTFDFNVGAAIAFQRLIHESYELDWSKFAHGKLEVKVNKKTFDVFMKQCEQRNFTWISNSKATEYNPWKSYENMSPYVQALVDMFNGGGPKEFIWVSIICGNLKWSDEHDRNLDEYEFI